MTFLEKKDKLQKWRRHLRRWWSRPAEKGDESFGRRKTVAHSLLYMRVLCIIVSVYQDKILGNSHFLVIDSFICSRSTDSLLGVGEGSQEHDVLTVLGRLPVGLFDQRRQGGRHVSHPLHECLRLVGVLLALGSEALVPEVLLRSADLFLGSDVVGQVHGLDQPCRGEGQQGHQGHQVCPPVGRLERAGRLDQVVKVGAVLLHDPLQLGADLMLIMTLMMTMATMVMTMATMVMMVISNSVQIYAVRQMHCFGCRQLQNIGGGCKRKRFEWKFAKNRMCTLHS